MVQSVPDPKNMAKALRSELRSRFEVDAAHSDCLEIVARQHGVDNWNILAVQKRTGAESASDEAKTARRWGTRIDTIAATSPSQPCSLASSSRSARLA
ncbi:hypothetical protein SAMN05443287_108137 [Micromonospora phaseoli]|uniref:Glyoxalase-related protein domain-containing protein n=1 Tax=Micromonospora phaseoli TaxID=1144548 RepID=A0A1H7BZ77_9ACTN|nr:hypothetical protein CLV64_110147 [Micromonospora phaseoli]SEJ82869.1 hypothetical protein SAMN05443287_108137 [Micromonospora phaseoli]